MCLGHTPSIPGSPEEPWGLQPPLPTKIAGPLPQPVLLSSEEQASSDLSAVFSRRERILSRVHERAGECWGALGGPRSSTLALSGSLQPGSSPPTLGCHFSGFCPDIADFAREALGCCRQRVVARALAVRTGMGARGRTRSRDGLYIQRRLSPSPLPSCSHLLES